MSLTSCLKKLRAAGVTLHKGDLSRIMALSRENRGPNVDADTAALKAIDTVLGELAKALKAASTAPAAAATPATARPQRPTLPTEAEVRAALRTDKDLKAAFKSKDGADNPDAGTAIAAQFVQGWQDAKAGTDVYADMVSKPTADMQLVGFNPRDSYLSGYMSFVKGEPQDIRIVRTEADDDAMIAAINAHIGAPGATPTPPAPATPPAAAKKRGPRAPRSADTLRAEADLNAALADLGDLLGKGTRLNMVAEPNDAKLLPVLTRVLDAAFRLGYHSFMDSAKFALDTIREKVGPEAADALTLDHLQGAYIAMAGGKEGVDSKRAVIDVESKDAIEQHNLDEEQGDVSGGTPDLERDRSEPAGQPDAGAGVPGDVAGPAAAGAGQAGARGARRQNLPRPPDGGPVAGGERVNIRVDGGKRPGGPAPGDPGADFNQRGDGPGATGVQPQSDAGAAPEDGAERVRSERERRQAQRAADGLKVTPGDRANIDATLPYLLPAQREDVHKAELQHAKPTGYGMLFTNGTGTGKTFSGLGVVKRRAMQGQGRQLIVVPDNKIAADWIESAKALNLTISQLADTKSAGEGIVITTYANLGDNDELARHQWDHVLADEAHSLMQSSAGDLTGYLQNLRAITYHPQGQHAAWLMRHRDQHNELASLAEAIDGNNKILGNPDTMEAMVASLRAENEKLQKRADAISRDLGQKREAIRKEWDAHQLLKRPRATFLSATPFAYHTSLEWGQGYLFDYKDGYPYDVDSPRAYNQPDPRQYFYMTHLGYRMRTNKLTQPDTSKVDIGMLERQLNSWMKKQGSLSGRMLEVDPDYDRRFVLIDSGIGNRIDEALQHLREQSNAQRQRNQDKKGDEPREHGWDALRSDIEGQFDYLSRRYLLEAIKARESIQIVRDHLKMGRRVVVFHDYKKGSGNNPFDVPELRMPERHKFDRLNDPQGEYDKYLAKVNGFNAARAQFRATFPELFTELVKLKSPIDAYREAFKEGPELLVINGDEKPKALLARYAQFQNDEGGPLVALVQSDKNKGWSGHDTTGKFQRVLLNLGLPTAPTKLIQLEGRIYRTGVVTDAIMRSLNTGTNWERWAFANTIASRASTAENLGMGELSRALRDSIIASFENADQFPPGHEGEGKGGKKMDRAANNVLSDFDRAKTFYWATGKKTSRNKSEEGKDYFATPEPLGFKMVEWADARSGEDLLEPSAGHGAIARWFPELANRTAIEPAPVLMSKLAMAMNPAKDRLIDGTFEDHDVVNKYDAIVMNPPFGVGGKQALEHVAKAARHLRDGGRIVALIPSGPAADKRLEQFLHGKEERPVRPIGALRNSATGREDDVYKGDRFESRASWAPAGVIVSMDPKENVLMVRPDGTAAGMTTRITAQAITKISQTGKRTEEFSPSEGLQLVADIKLPSVTFERAGTGVWSHIIVLEKTKENVGTTQQVDLAGIPDVNELFDRIEKLGLRPRAKPIEEAAPEQPAGKAGAKQEAAIAQTERGGEELIEHTTAKGKVIRGIVRKGIDKAAAQKIDPYTFPKNGGFFIREKYLKNDAQEPHPEYGEEYDLDLFGNAVPRPAPAAPKAPPRKRTVVRQQALDLEGSQPELDQPAAPPARSLTPELYVDTMLSPVYHRELGTERITTPEELATASQYLYKSAVERFDAIVTDKDGKPLGVIGAFKGDRSQTAVYPFTVLSEALAIPGAANVWFTHNHPSGTSKLSDADIRLYKTFSRAFVHTGIETNGIMAIGKGTFGYYDHLDNETRDQPIPASTATTSVPVFERHLVDERQAPLTIGSPSAAKDYAAAFYLRSGGPGIMLMDTQNQVAGWLPLGERLLSRLTTGTALRELLTAATHANTSSAILVHGGELDPRVMGLPNSPPIGQNLTVALNKADIRVLDVINAKDRTSRAERGIDYSPHGELFSIQAKGGMWRSELEESIAKATMKQAPAAGWLSFLDGLSKRGVKPAEIEWSGVREWLQLVGDKTGRISKEDVLTFLSANGVQVSEQVLGGAAKTSEANSLRVELDALGYTVSENTNGLVLHRRSDGQRFIYSNPDDAFIHEDDTEAETPRKLEDARAVQMGLRLDALTVGAEYTDPDEDYLAAKYEKYTEPGGGNYREVLLTLPAKPRAVTYGEAKPFGGTGEAMWNGSQSIKGVTEMDVLLDGQSVGNITHWPYTVDWRGERTPGVYRVFTNHVQNAQLSTLEAAKAAIEKDAASGYATKNRPDVFRSGHWRGTDNVLAHIRVKDRINAQGEKVLFVEEIQSDWAQEARRHGYRDEELPDDAFTVEEKHNPNTNHTFYEVRLKTKPGAIAGMGDTRADALKHAKGVVKSVSVPRGPFVSHTDGWLTLALKRIVMMAAQEGYQQVAFTSGEQNVKRYALETHVDKLYYRRADDGWAVSFVPKDEPGELKQVDVPTDGELEEYVGEEMAAKMRKGEGPVSNPASGMRVLEGAGLKVGGSGMRTFYDQIIPRALGRLLAKTGGGQVETVQIGKTAKGEGIASSADITKAAKDYIRGTIDAKELIENAGLEGLATPLEVEATLETNFDPYDNGRVAREAQYFANVMRGRASGSKAMKVSGFTVTPAMREAALQGMPLFNRPRMTTEEVRAQLAAARGMSIDKAQAAVKSITEGWKGGITVKVVATPKDLPTNNPHPGTKGLYLNGVGYVVASKHKTVQELGRTIAHEVLAHHGLRNSLGEEGWKRLMGQIQAAANAGNPEIAAAREYVRQAYRHADGSYMLKEGGTLEADEVAARLIESSVDAQGNMKPKLQFLKWVWAKLASFLRSVGLNIPLTVPELHGVYADALADIRAGKGVLTGELATADGLEARGARTIQVAGKERPIENSDGNTIATEFKHQQNFWKWFGDSKVVDGEGRPLVVYHGTQSDFKQFDLGTVDRPGFGFGFHFAEDPAMAAFYAENWKDGERAPGDIVMPVYLSIKKPFTGDYYAFMEKNVIARSVSEVAAAGGRHQMVRKLLQEEGYDGIRYKHDEKAGAPRYAWVAFEPTQIKSLFNRGAFNPKDTDILYAIDIAGGVARPGGYTPEQMTAMRNVGFAREVPPLKDKLRSMWKDAGKKLAQGLVDQFAPIKDISKEAYGLLRLSKGAAGAFEVLLHGGQLKLNAGVYDFDEKKRGGAIDRFLIPLQGEHHDFLRWVAANRAEQLTREDREHLFTADDIRALKTLSDGQLAGDFTLQHGPKAGQTTRSRAEAWADSLATFNEFNKNTLDMAQESGLIDAEGRKLWEREFYVPFYRVEDEGGVRGMNIKSGVVRQQAFKHLKGGSQQLNNDLLENTLMNWAHLIDAAAKNRAAKATLEAMQNLGSAIEAPENDVRQMAKSISKRNNVVWFMDAGRQRHFLVDDPYLLAAVSALEFSGFNSPVMKALGATKRALTMGVTASPFFKVRNLIRDTVQAIGSAPLSGNPLTNLREGLAVVGKGTLGGHNTDEWYRLLAGGGTIHFGTMMEGSEAKRVQALIESGVDKATILDSGDKVMGFYRHTVEPLITAYNELGNRGEAINRAALYQQLRKQGVSHAEASLQARDLMDFSMQGSFTTVRFLTQVVPFMNARLQGLYKLGRAAAEDPARFAAVLAATSVLSIGLLAAYSDDDDWKKREDWDRNNYWWFKAGGTAYRIPKPFEIGAMATLAERTWELAFEKEMTNQRFRQQVIALLGDNLSMNPIPQLVKPIIDVYANTDSFTNRPIEPMGMEKLQPQYRYREDTSMAARGASTVLSAGARAVGAEGLSPLQIDHLTRAYFGWLGTLAISAGDVLARPATGQPAQPTPDYWKVLTGSMVAGMADAPSRYVTDVYTQSKQLEQIYGTWSHLVREGKMQEAQAFRGEYAQELVRYRQVEAVKRAMTQINQLKKQVEEGAASADEKRARLRELNDRADLIARRLAPV